MTVGEMLKRISASELNRWGLYERLYGELGPGHADVSTAVVAKTIADVNRGKKDKPYSLTQFMAYVNPDDPEYDDDDPYGDENDEGDDGCSPLAAV